MNDMQRTVVIVLISACVGLFVIGLIADYAVDYFHSRKEKKK